MSKMTRSMALTEDAHKLMRKIQSGLYSKYEVDMHMSDILICMISEIGTTDIVVDRLGQKAIKNHTEKIVNSSNNIQLIKS